jgi:hypothetical protein
MAKALLLLYIEYSGKGRKREGRFIKNQERGGCSQ